MHVALNDGGRVRRHPRHGWLLSAPKGRAVFTPNGYAAFIIVGANRKPATNNDETAALLKSLLVYTGKFTIDGDKFTTKVDMSGNELLTGQDQVRFFKLEGDQLSIRTAEQVSSVFAGKKVVGTLTWNANADSGGILVQSLPIQRATNAECPTASTMLAWHQARDRQ
jgi:hypothetical protein